MIFQYVLFLFIGFCLICFEQNAWGGKKTKPEKNRGATSLSMRVSNIEQGQADVGEIEEKEVDISYFRREEENRLPDDSLSDHHDLYDDLIKELLVLGKPEYYHHCTEGYLILRNCVDRRRDTLIEYLEEIKLKNISDRFLISNREFLDPLVECFLLEVEKKSDFVFHAKSIIDNKIKVLTELKVNMERHVYFESELVLLDSLNNLRKHIEKNYSMVPSAKGVSFSDNACYSQAIFRLSVSTDERLSDFFNKALIDIIANAISSCENLLSVSSAHRISVLFNKRESLVNKSPKELFEALRDTDDDYYVLPCFMMLGGWVIDTALRIIFGVFLPGSYGPVILKILNGVILEEDRGFDCFTVDIYEWVNQQNFTTREDNIYSFSGTMVDLEVDHQFDPVFIYIPLCAVFLDVPMSAVGYIADIVNNQLFKREHRLTIHKTSSGKRKMSAQVSEAANNNQVIIESLDDEINAIRTLSIPQIKSLTGAIKKLQEPKQRVVLYASTLFDGTKQLFTDVFKSCRHGDCKYFTRHVNMHGTTILYIGGILYMFPQWSFIYIAKTLLSETHGEILPNESMLVNRCNEWVNRQFGSNITLDNIHMDVRYYHQHPEWRKLYLNESYNVTGPLRGSDYNLFWLDTIILGLSIFNNGLYQGAQSLVHLTTVNMNRTCCGCKRALLRCCNSILRKRAN
ncbi:hypothetical protein CI610_00791 [invertebrate metagenome]|uniref:Uncharacterized protein n=1 Tax=invertebrate metagenome TaxID=1711999 RepID=A0A2H9TAK7_9ZZZZ